MKNSEIKEELDKALGDVDGRLLSQISESVSDKSVEAKLIKTIEAQGKESQEATSRVVDRLERVNLSVKSNRVKIPEVHKVKVENPVDMVTIKNAQDIGKAVKIPPYPQPLESVSIKQADWLVKPILFVSQAVSSAIKALGDRILRVKVIDTSDPKKPVSVRLSDGNRFYNAVSSVATAIGKWVPFINQNTGAHQEPIVNDAGRLQVDVVTGGGSGGGTQYDDGDARGTATGTLAMGDDGANIQSLRCNDTGLLLNQHTDGTNLTPAGDADARAVYVNLGGNNDVTVTSGSVEVDGTALGNGQVTVDNTLNGTTIVAASAGRQGVTITNQGTVDCYIGTGNVAANNGFLLKGGESVALPTDSEIKGFCSADSTVIGYLTFA